MKIQLTVEYDGTEEQCDSFYDDLVIALEDGEIIDILTGGATTQVSLLHVKELPALGRPKKEAP